MKSMKTLQVFDPAMCCSTGVCGPSVDTQLASFAADLVFLKQSGISVERFNLGHDTAQFMANPTVLEEMGEEAENLPIIILNGEVLSKGRYPDRAELCAWCGVDSAKPARASLTLLGQSGAGQV